MFRRALVPALAAVIAAAVPSTAAADPALGATLGATREVVIVDSAANVAMLVTLTAPSGWTLAETEFVIQPGGRHVVAIRETGEEGQIVATFQAIEVPVGTDRTSMVLSLGTPKPTPIEALPLWAVLAVVAVLMLAIGRRAPRIRSNTTGASHG